MALERGGSLLSGGGPDGQRAFVLGADGSTTEVALPELSSPYGLWTQNGSAAWVVELHDPQPWVPLRVGIEHDGMVLELTERAEGWTWILRDASTGAVLAEDTEPSHEDIWVFDEATETLDIVIADPTTGDELLRVPPEVHEAAFEATYSSVEPADTAAYAPDLWLLATADGVEWHVEDLPDADLWPQSAAINGDRVLYRTVDGWQLTTIS
ncbi:MAG: hypothetical protein HKN41_07920 [Ilumatobacter sp.]|nr:hypothetical protein [Ilumatobacter sp.]